VSDSTDSQELQTVNVVRRGGVATVELNRPTKLNAWDKQFGLDLLHAIETVGADDSVRAVVIRGAGRGFSAGADLTSMGSGDDHPSTPDGLPDVYKVLTQRYHPIISGIRKMPKPVVAAVHGPAAGIGCSLALACDLVVADPTAYFLLAFVNIGLVPDGGSSLFIPARIGFARAAQMAMLGERVNADQALQWGLINRVFADGTFDQEVDALMDGLAAGPTASYAGTKRQLNSWLYARMDEQLELEATIQQEMIGSADFTEGVLAFTSKRPPNFCGS